MTDDGSTSDALRADIEALRAEMAVRKASPHKIERRVDRDLYVCTNCGLTRTGLDIIENTNPFLGECMRPKRDESIEEINLLIWRLLQETSRVGLEIPHHVGEAMAANLERILGRVRATTLPLPPGGPPPSAIGDLPNFGASEFE